MKLHYLKLKNYRCFDQIELVLHPQLTVIVGGNGAGKSSLLDAITVALGPYLSQFDDGKGDDFKQTDALRLPTSKNHYEMQPQYPIELHAVGQWIPILPPEDDYFRLVSPINYRNASELLTDLAGQPVTPIQHMLNKQAWSNHHHYWRRALMGAKNKTTIKEAAVLADYGHSLQKRLRKDSSVVLPLLSYYGTGRLWALQKLTQAAEHILSGSRTLGYRECLNKSSSYKEFAYWFKQLHLAIVGNIDLVEQGLPAEHDDRLRAIRKAVVDTINICLADSEWEGLHYSAATQEIQVRKRGHDGGVMPVSQLSDGIRSVLALAADIAFRCCKLNGHLGAEAVRQTPGIVLIDELDLHLHPAWQQTIVSAFQKAFPLIQLVLTTHSPHLLSTVPSECIRILDKGSIRSAPEGIQGAESQRVLKLVFGVDTRPQHTDIVKKLNTYLQWVEQGDGKSAYALNLRQELELHFKNEEPMLTEADTIMENQDFLQYLEQDDDEFDEITLNMSKS